MTSMMRFPKSIWPRSGGPCRDSGCLLNRGRFRIHKLHVGHLLKLRVGGGVISVRVGMDHHQRHRRVILALRPLGHQVHDDWRGRDYDFYPLSLATPVSSSSALFSPKIRYRKGFSALMQPDSRRM